MLGVLEVLFIMMKVGNAVNVLTWLFGRDDSAPGTVVSPAGKVVYPYIFEGYDDGYDRVHPKIVLRAGECASLDTFLLSAGETVSVRFADGVVAEVGHRLTSDWDDSDVFHLVPFEMYEEFVRTVECF